MAKPRMTTQTLRILSVMLEDPYAEWYGLQLAKAADTATGTLYPILSRLENATWLASTWEDVAPSAEGRPRRRLYRLTGEGADNARLAVDEALQQLARPGRAGARLGGMRPRGVTS